MGVGLQVGEATVRYNTFTGNKGNTIVVQGGTPVTIEYNNLEGNTGTYDLYLNIPSGVSVLAQHNWWGTTDNLVIAERVYDWNDDDLKATASYNLKATKPDQTAPGYVRSIAVLPNTTLGIQTGTFDIQFSRAMNAANNPQLSYASATANTWVTRANMPTNRNSLGVVTASNGKIYAIGGYNGSSAVSTVEEYNPTTNTWVTRASMPTSRYLVGVAAANNGKIYAIGGNSNGNFLSTVEEYNPATNTWATRASMPTGRWGSGVVTASNGKIYVIGGDNGTNSQGIFTSTVEEYDPSN